MTVLYVNTDFEVQNENFEHFYTDINLKYDSCIT